MPRTAYKYDVHINKTFRIFFTLSVNTNMNTLVCNMQYYKVLQLETRTENPCVGGSIPPLATIIYSSQKFLFFILKYYALSPYSCICLAILSFVPYIK